MFHEVRKINVASSENVPPPVRHVFQPTGTSFELVQDIIGTQNVKKNWVRKILGTEKNRGNGKYTYMYPRLYPNWSGLPDRAIYLRPTMNNRAILEGATSLTPPSIAFSSIQFSTGKCWSH
ncbi:hypothetical protein DPMN_160914 [Dreissena polymorpha]|uniref:Uncharacterized protein n=1 Tax=Dreissena polymorpha TaxID=45954 RepID=A0A9D4IT00_DREPO|nr:hypothetical protein DPMN_160914 [Dreissena polymorpha]